MAAGASFFFFLSSTAPPVSLYVLPACDRTGGSIYSTRYTAQHHMEQYCCLMWHTWHSIHITASIAQHRHHSIHMAQHPHHSIHSTASISQHSHGTASTWHSTHITASTAQHPHHSITCTRESMKQRMHQQCMQQQCMQQQYMEATCNFQATSTFCMLMYPWQLARSSTCYSSPALSLPFSLPFAPFFFFFFGVLTCSVASAARC